MCKPGAMLFPTPGLYVKAVVLANRNPDRRTMELPRRLTIALHTLNAAVDLLETAVERSAAANTARLDALLDANTAVGARLDRVAVALRALSEAQPLPLEEPE